MSQLYYRLVKNILDSKNRRNYLVPVGESPQEFIEKIDPDADWYKSLYYYDEEHRKQWDKVKSFAGFSGVYTDKIIFDLDKEDDVELAHKEAQEIVTALIHNGVESDAVAVYFSGNKGFHIELLTDKTMAPTELKSICVNIASELELQTFDPRVYDAQRVIRLELTKHNKTGLYKYPLSIEELYNKNVDYFREVSAEVLNVLSMDERKYVKPAIELPEGIYDLRDSEPEKILAGEKQAITGNSDFDSLDYTAIDYRNKPKWMPAYKYAAQQGYFPPGTRNVVLLSLGATYKAQGFDMEATYGLLKGVTRNQANVTGQDRFPNEELYNNIVKQLFSDTWQGGQFSAETNPILAEIQNRLPPPYNKNDKEKKPHDLYNLDEVYEKFQDFGLNIDDNTITTGITAIDNNCRITIGTHTGILAAPGTGKCLGKGTKILMYDGSIKKVEHIKVGELIMGDDSTPRKVLGVCNGVEKLYKVKQSHGMTYVVNASHILSVKHYLTQKVWDVNVEEFLKSSDKLEFLGYKGGDRSKAFLSVLTITDIGEGEYYGFEIDGNKRFLLEDSTVTHNTSLAINILSHNSQKGIKCLFFSLDMYHALIYQKQLQKLTGWNDKTIFKMLAEKNPRVLEAHEKLKQDYSNVIYNFNSGTTVEDIESVIDYYQETSGEKIKLVLIDYAECLQGPFADAFANMKLIAHQLKDLANSKDVAVITLVQPQKASGDPSEPLYSMRQIKGPSDWEQGFALVLGLSRPGYSPNTPEKDRYMTINALKHRMGRLFSVDCYFDGARSMVYDIDENGQIEVDEIREAKAKMNKEKKGGW